MEFKTAPKTVVTEVFPRLPRFFFRRKDLILLDDSSCSNRDEDRHASSSSNHRAWYVCKRMDESREGGSDFARVQIQGQPPVCSATMDKVPNKEKPNLAIIYLVFESTINQIN